VHATKEKPGKMNGTLWAASTQEKTARQKKFATKQKSRPMYIGILGVRYVHCTTQNMQAKDTHLVCVYCVINKRPCDARQVQGGHDKPVQPPG
jgi:hypothetical protein